MQILFFILVPICFIVILMKAKLIYSMLLVSRGEFQKSQIISLWATVTKVKRKKKALLHNPFSEKRTFIEIFSIQIPGWEPHAIEVKKARRSCMVPEMRAEIAL